MKIAVCVKHAVDESELKVSPSGVPVLEGALGKMGTFDKNAVEEAARMKSQHGGEIEIFSVGTADTKKTIKEALAMGADRGTLVNTAGAALDALGVSALLAACLKAKGPFDIVICSEGSSDIYTGEVPPMLAQRLGVPFIGFARKVQVGAGKVVAECSLEESVETIEAALPAVISVVSEANEPRYPTLIQIMQAGKKPLEERNVADLGVDIAAAVKVLTMNAQAPVRKRIMIEGTPAEAAAKLVASLRAEGVLPR